MLYVVEKRKYPQYVKIGYPILCFLFYFMIIYHFAESWRIVEKRDKLMDLGQGGILIRKMVGHV